MKALLFPGQGSQVVGMGLEFYKNFEIARKIFLEADENLNFNATTKKKQESNFNTKSYVEDYSNQEKSGNIYDSF